MLRFFFTLSLLILHCTLSFAQQSANVVFIGNSITYGALHENREQTAPPVRCAEWLSAQRGIDTVYVANCGRSGKTTWNFLPNAADVVPAGEKTYFPEVVMKTRQLVMSHPGLPLVFSIMLGTNDTVERRHNSHTTPEAYVRNLCTLIDSLLTLWPDAHVVLNKPIWYYPDYVTRNGSVASQESLKLLDAYQKSFPQVVAHCRKGQVHIGDSKAYGYFRKHYRTDVFEEKDSRGQSYWLHPNEQGAAVLARYWGKAILPVLKKIQAAPVPVVLTAGQSNADGRVPMADLPVSFQDYSYCLWSYGSGDFESATGYFLPFRPRVAKPGIEQSWGFDAVVYRQLEQYWQQPFFVIKHTDGGTAIDPRCSSSTHGLYWSADPSFLDTTTSASHGGRSLLKAFEQQIDDCLKHLPANYQIKFLIWHQGESDRQAADTYYRNLQAVITHLRQHLAQKTGKAEYLSLPVVCGTFSKDSRQGSAKVAEALRQLSQDDPNFYVVDASDLSLLPDRLHFDAQAAQILGIRFFEVLKANGLL
ncbi:MAG: hypothetical protein J6P82_02785 [Bacteroidales bacterium]|nr:hypothetical protein [Bacteroidales bacterium]